MTAEACPPVFGDAHLGPARLGQPTGELAGREKVLGRRRRPVDPDDEPLDREPAGAVTDLLRRGEKRVVPGRRGGRSGGLGGSSGDGRCRRRGQPASRQES